MSNVSFSSDGPPEVVLPESAAAFVTDLERAIGDARPRAEVAKVVAANPEISLGWATLGELVERQAVDEGAKVEAYAYFRIGYHRGLDALRQNGWKGSGYVRWAHESNRGFLRSLDGLRRLAASIGEVEEARRCTDFLSMLDPDGPPAD